MYTLYIENSSALFLSSDPWTMQWSKSQQKKYFFNLQNGQSSYNCPQESIATVRYLHLLHMSFKLSINLTQYYQISRGFGLVDQ